MTRGLWPGTQNNVAARREAPGSFSGEGRGFSFQQGDLSKATTNRGTVRGRRSGGRPRRTAQQNGRRGQAAAAEPATRGDHAATPCV